MSKKKPITKKEISLPIEYNIPKGLMTPFATNMIIQNIEHEFKITFFEIKPFIRLDESQSFPDKVEADCVASVIVTADRLPKFIQALENQLEKYKLAQSKN